MSNATLTSLLDYLYGTLTIDNMRWVGEHLIDYAKKQEAPVKRCTMEEINAMIDEAEADIAAGRVIDHEDMMREWEEEMEPEAQAAQVK